MHFCGSLMVGLSVIATLTSAYSFSERKWKFLLPNNIIKELIQLDANASSDPVGVDRAIDTLLRAQPAQVLDQLDLPPYYESLPFVQRWQIKEILFDRQLSYQQKHQMIYDLIHKLPPDQQRFPPVNNQQHSRYFEAFSTLQYQIEFTFKLSEIKHALPPRDMQLILHVLGNPQIQMESKLAEIERVMYRQSFDVFDRLFFTGVPIVDAEVRERFRRLFVEKGFWTVPPKPTLPNHLNCVLKPWCNLKFKPKISSERLNVTTMNQMNPINGQIDSIKMQQQNEVIAQPQVQLNPINGQIDWVKGQRTVEEALKDTEERKPESAQPSMLIEVQAGNSDLIKQEIPIKSLSSLPTIVIESHQTEAGKVSKMNVFVKEQNETNNPSGELKPSEWLINPSPRPNQNQQALSQFQNPSSNLPWQLPSYSQPSRVAKYSASEATSTSSTATNRISTEPWQFPMIKPSAAASGSLQQDARTLVKQPLSTAYSSPTRWSIIRTGPWTHQDEKAFLQKWYKHFGIALNDASSSVTTKTIEPDDVTTKVEKKIENKSATSDQEKLVNVIDEKQIKPDEGKLMDPGQDKSKLSESAVKKAMILLQNDQNVGTSEKTVDSETPNLTSGQTPARFSLATEANINALRQAHEKQYAKIRAAELSEDMEAKSESRDEDKSYELMTDEKAKARDDVKPELKLSNRPLQQPIQSSTIRPPTVVINKEAKEKLVVRHSLKEKMTSAEFRDSDSSVNITDNAPKHEETRKEMHEEEDPNKVLQQPLNDTGTDLSDSVVDDEKKDSQNKVLATKSEDKVPSGLLKLRDVLRRLRERIKQMPKHESETPTWQNN